MLARGDLEFSEYLTIRAQQSRGTGLGRSVDSKYVQIAGYAWQIVWFNAPGP